MSAPMFRILSLFLLLLSGMVSAVEPIRIAGSTTAQPLVDEIARLYLDKYPQARLEVAGGGSGSGIAALIARDVDIAMSSRLISAGEVEQAVRLGIYPVPLQLAHDAIAPVVHPRNPLRDLSRDQLSDIYLGRSLSWATLGGPDVPIGVVCRDRNSGTRASWQHLALNGTPAQACSIDVASNQEVLEAVRSNQASIGYVSLAFISAHAGVRPLQVEGQDCTPYCIKSGCYPLTRPLFLFTNGWPDGKLMHFINFALHSEQAKQVIRRAGLIPAN